MEELYTVAARTPATCVAMLRGGGVWRSFLLRGSQSDPLAAARGSEHRRVGGGAAAEGVLALRRELFGASRCSDGGWDLCGLFCGAPVAPSDEDPAFTLDDTPLYMCGLEPDGYDTAVFPLPSQLRAATEASLDSISAYLAVLGVCSAEPELCCHMPRGALPCGQRLVVWSVRLLHPLSVVYLPVDPSVLSEFIVRHELCSALVR